ncbi:MAG: hypothetical protein WCG01_04905 [bacterium]
MTIYQALKRLAKNNLLELSDNLFAKGKLYKLENLTEELINNSKLSFIVGEHPSEYALSPQMWNAEFHLRHSLDIFLPFDIAANDTDKLYALFDLLVKYGGKHFRVLTVTNPHKVVALEYFKKLQISHPDKIDISQDALEIGATNQILVGPDNVLHVINSDGRGMANAIENLLVSNAKGLAGKKVGIIGAGGAARGIIYEISKRVSQVPGGCVTVFNRTPEKVIELVNEFTAYFPGLKLEAKKLADLPELSLVQDVIVSSITSGNPLADFAVYGELPDNTLIVDANYGSNSILFADAQKAGRSDLRIFDGSGMVVEGYIIPSKELAKLWGYEVSMEIYQTIGKLFDYQVAVKN